MGSGYISLLNVEPPLTVRVRLAPSPTGPLHIGTARTAVFNWLYARRNKGRFLLRIEDTDKQRSKPEFTRNILEGLRWLGIDWDEEPVVQSARGALHRQAIADLLASGKAYRCYCSEAELEAMRNARKAAGQPPRYDNRHRHLTADQEAAFQREGREAVVRFAIDDSEEIHWHDLVRGPMAWSGRDLGGDMVIARRCPADSIGDPLYNLVVVLDDAFMDISHVIRGEDHIANTAKQLLLYRALGLKAPSFAHTPLILNRDGRKLSKRDGVTSISDFQAMGYTAEAIGNYMGLLGWSPPQGMGERFTLVEASRHFDFDRVNRAGARFDWDKLNWINGQVLHGQSSTALRAQLEPLWRQAGFTLPADPAWLDRLTGLISPSLTLLKDGVDQARPFLTTPEPDQAARDHLASEGCRAALLLLLEGLPDRFDDAAVRALLGQAAKAAGVSRGVLMKGVRAALLGSLQGPDLMASWALLSQRGEDRGRLLGAID